MLSFRVLFPGVNLPSDVLHIFIVVLFFIMVVHYSSVSFKNRISHAESRLYVAVLDYKDHTKDSIPT